MTMPVVALFTPAAMPQNVAQRQSALTDYTEDQPQSYSADLAELLAGMEDVLTQLDVEIQLPQAEVGPQPVAQDIVQSMLSQPLLFDPLLPVTSQPPVTALVSFAAEADLTEGPVAVHSEFTSTLPPTEENGIELQLRSSSAFNNLFWPSAGAGQQQNALSADAKSFAVPASAQQGLLSEATAVQLERQQNSGSAPEATVALLSGLNSSQYSGQSNAFNTSFNFNQNSMVTASLSKVTELPKAMVDILAPAAAVAPLTSSASSALPVWQADPLPTQSQHWGQRLVQMLADKVDLQLGLSVNKAMIRLDPPSLGSIELSVQLDGDRLTVQMHSSNGQLREAMGLGLEQLRASLQQKLGADVQIDLRMGSDSSSQQQQQKTRQQFTQQADANFYSEPEMAGIEATQPNRLNLVNQLV